MLLFCRERRRGEVICYYIIRERMRERKKERERENIEGIIDKNCIICFFKIVINYIFYGVCN